MKNKIGLLCLFDFEKSSWKIIANNKYQIKNKHKILYSFLDYFVFVKLYFHY